MIKDGILCAGGAGTRMRPITDYLSKHLVNVSGKPLIDYPLNTLKQLGVENLTIVVGSLFSGQILDYVKDGEKFGMNVSFRYQKNPSGIANAIDICKDNVRNNFVVCLADNIFSKQIKFVESPYSAKIVLYAHNNIKRFGVASLNDENQIVKIEEKPQILDENLKNFAITGCYIFDQKYFEFYKKIKPSHRAEFEIVDIIRQYQEINDLGYLNYHHQDGVWLDAGTHESVSIANNYFYSLNRIQNGIE